MMDIKAIRAMTPEERFAAIWQHAAGYCGCLNKQVRNPLAGCFAAIRDLAKPENLDYEEESEMTALDKLPPAVASSEQKCAQPFCRHAQDRHVREIRTGEAFRFREAFCLDCNDDGDPSWAHSFQPPAVASSEQKCAHKYVMNITGGAHADRFCGHPADDAIHHPNRHDGHPFVPPAVASSDQKCGYVRFPPDGLRCGLPLSVHYADCDHPFQPPTELSYDVLVVVPLPVVKFCAEEVGRQGRGPMQVWWMVVAWMEAIDDEDRGDCLSPRMIQRWGYLVEREKNRDGAWRTCGVRVGLHICPRPDEIPALIARWFGNKMTAEEAYREFEEIHPFADGNGRVGKIIYNWLRGTLGDPQLPPNFWGIANP